MLRFDSSTLYHHEFSYMKHILEGNLATPSPLTKHFEARESIFLVRSRFSFAQKYADGNRSNQSFTSIATPRACSQVCIRLVILEYGSPNHHSKRYVLD